MASHPPSLCCTQGFRLEGTPQGKLIDIEDINTYVTGDKSSSKVLLLFTDVLGHVFPNAQLVADSYASKGYYVVVPDLFYGDPVILNGGIPDGWFEKHNFDRTGKVANKILQYIKSELKPEFIASIGYCYGARLTIKLLDDASIDVGAAAHPSFVQMDEVAQIKKPIIILAAETDSIFPDDLREATKAKLQEIGATYHITLTSGVSHGFAVRGDPKDEWNNIAKIKAFNDSLWWFKLFAPHSN